MIKKWQKLLQRTVQNSPTRRGDTLIEVMFAIAVFSMVAVISISMMNAGVASGERSLELVTARNELNAQAEILRFIHSSYVSELTLPKCTNELISKGEKCQQFANLWQEIVKHAMAPRDGTNSTFSLPEGILGNCTDYYNGEGGLSLLRQNHAFVLNGRKIGADQLSAGGTTEMAKNVYISILTQPEAFRAPTLGARMVYTEDETGDVEQNSSTVELSSSQRYDYLKFAEGIWVVAVGGKYDSQHTDYDFYDFYIQTCWFGSNSNAPTSIDSVIRLYNPEAERNDPGEGGEGE